MASSDASSLELLQDQDSEGDMEVMEARDDATAGVPRACRKRKRRVVGEIFCVVVIISTAMVAPDRLQAYGEGHHDMLLAALPRLEESSFFYGG